MMEADFGDETKDAQEALANFSDAVKLTTKRMAEFNAKWRRRQRAARRFRQWLAARKGPARQERAPKRRRYYRTTGLPKRTRQRIRSLAKRKAGLNRKGVKRTYRFLRVTLGTSRAATRRHHD